MANIKSAKKRIRSNAKKTKTNNYWKKAFRESVANLSKAISTKKEKTEIEKMNNKLKSVVDKATKRKVISKGKAARVKSKFQKLV